MSCWDFVDAVERRQQQQSCLSKICKRILSFFSEDISKVYLREARQKHHFLAIRLASNAQVQQVRDLLALHQAHLIKYIDTWTAADLAPAPEFERTFSTAGVVEWRKPYNGAIP
jgi:hypothetical protein